MVEPSSAAENSSNSIPSPRRSQRGNRSRRRSRRSSRGNYEKSLVNFSSLHIGVGVIAACLQMVHFTNNSILSQSQPGLWCGTFFVVTGAVCLSLSKTRGIYSTLAMLAFCLVSLFMALTLSSLSWLGAEASSICQATITNCNNQTIPYSQNFDESSQEVIPERQKECDIDDDGLYDCHDVFVNFCCGYNISLGRTIHSLLMFIGIFEATTSFILAAVACTRSSNPPRNRYPSLFPISMDGNDIPGTHARPVTAWDYPALNKEDIFSIDVNSRQLPDEPPPPYEANENERSENNITRF